MTSARMLSLSAVLGCLYVLLGAFGAHGLKGLVGEPALAWWETGVRYHGIHALALFGAGILARTGTAPRLSAWAFVVGTVLFSGSLYAMTLTDLRWLGAVTPIGGLAFAIGWLALLPHCRTANAAATARP